MTTDSYGTRATLRAGDRQFQIHRINALPNAERLPFSLKILLENLLRHEDGVTVKAADIEALANWDPNAEPTNEIAFAPARVLMQDFTGVPCIVDLAAMRDAMTDLGGDTNRVNPQIPSSLVIDHSVAADVAGLPEAFRRNSEIEFERNIERYEFLRWGQTAFNALRVVPPNTGICHQVNLEYLSRVVWTDGDLAYPDTLVGTDSHTTMVNGLGVLGWGVGGIEAEAAMLGQPISMLVPRVVGLKLTGELPEGTTATDLVLFVTELLREHGVVGKFVELYGPGVAAIPLANRATIGNMSPEYGSTCAIWPIDDETLRYLRFTGRPDELVQLVEVYAKEQGLWHDINHEPDFSERLELDLSTVVPSLAGPSRPQDRVCLDEVPASLRRTLISTGALKGADEGSVESFPASDPPSVSTENGERLKAEKPLPPPPPNGLSHNRVPVALSDGTQFDLDHGHVVIAAITSCTNTSNPSVMLAAGLLARNAVRRGLQTKPWVKTSLAPGSKVVMDYYERAGLTADLEALRFYLVGFGCTTCIGNSGPLAPEISAAVSENDLSVAAVLSGNRNFEGRINPDTRLNYLASPPLVVAYALAGSMTVDLRNDPLGTGSDGKPVYLRDIWPSTADVATTVEQAVQSDMFRKSYGEVFEGDERWKNLPVPTGDRFEWNSTSTYVRKPPYFDNMPAEPVPPAPITNARALAVFGDSITTDHISPAGNIAKDSPAGRFLIDGGVAPGDFNVYGSRRGNHEVMIRGTFANIRIRNRLTPGTEGGVTIYFPTGEEMPIYDAAMRYQQDGTPLVVLAGKEYGTGSSRDWAAKGTALLGVRAVITESFERIHRSNLIGMGVLPLQFTAGDNAESLGLTGHETFSIEGDPAAIGAQLTVHADDKSFPVLVRIDTPKEVEYFQHGGILQYVLRQLRAR
jgi:aconitate hydratase